MEDRKRRRTAKLTITLDLEDALQKKVYEKVIYRNRYKYRTQSEYILDAVLQYEEPEYPTCHLADADRHLLVKEIQNILGIYNSQPGV